MVKDIGTGGFKFDSRAGQIGQNVANSSPPLRRYLRSCIVQALSRRDGSRHSLHAVASVYPAAAGTMKVRIFVIVLCSE